MSEASNECDRCRRFSRFLSFQRWIGGSERYFTQTDSRKPAWVPQRPNWAVPAYGRFLSFHRPDRASPFLPSQWHLSRVRGITAGRAHSEYSPARRTKHSNKPVRNAAAKSAHLAFRFDPRFRATVRWCALLGTHLYFGRERTRRTGSTARSRAGRAEIDAPKPFDSRRNRVHRHRCELRPGGRFEQPSIEALYKCPKDSGIVFGG